MMLPDPMPVRNAAIDAAGPVFIVVFIALLFIQWKWPLRRQHFSRSRRVLRNIGVAAPPILASRLGLVPIPFFVSLWASGHHFGLFNLVKMPSIGIRQTLYNQCE